MKIKVIFIGSGFTKKEQKLIKNTIQNTAKDVVQILNIQNDVTFTVYRYGRMTGGFAQAKDWIRINISSKQFKKDDFIGTICHEMHHIARNYVGYSGKKYDLLNSLFAEGLATVFHLNYSKSKKVPRFSQYNVQTLKKYFPEIKKNIHNDSFNYEEWFFGVGKPIYLGYKVGRYLVDEIIKNNPDITIEGLTKKSANQLLKLSKVNF
jgi:uncharacterized protein YjaZ